MHWTLKSQQRQHYCAVHNADCSLHSHPGDPTVLDVSPMLVPGAWICPEAVIEIASMEDEAHEYIERNDPTSPEGFVTRSFLEEIAFEAAQFADDHHLMDKINHSGIESCSHDELGALTRYIEEYQDDLPKEAEELHSQILEVI